MLLSVLCFVFVVGLLFAFRDRIGEASRIPVNMMAKYHRNAILTGYIDAYCLVCDSYLRSEEDVEGHIAKPVHIKNLDSTGFIEKYKDDYIRKVKKGYYCEFCNILFSTAAKVGLHVAEEKHATNKGSQLLKRSGSNVIAFQNIVINEKAWHGLIDETCTICNSEFDDSDIHKTETTHILNLVQNKIDESSYQCLTCNLVLGTNTITTHFDSNEHKKFYVQCQQAELDNETTSSNVVNRQQQQNTEVNASPKPDVKKPVPSTAPAKKPEVTTSKSETAKKPATVEPQKKIDIPPTKAEKPKLEVLTEDLDEEICKALDAKDYIANTEKGQKWCLLCDWTIDTILIQSHVCGKHHQTMLKMHKERLQKKKMAAQSASVETAPVKIDTSADQVRLIENRKKIVEMLTKHHFYELSINFDKQSIVCNKCSKSVEFDPNFVEQHILEHKNTVPKKEAGKATSAPPTPPAPSAPAASPAPPAPNAPAPDEPKIPSPKPDKFKKPQAKEEKEKRASSAASNKEKDSEEDVEKYAKSHDLAYSRGDTKVYCRVCDTRVPSSLKNMKEHIAGLSHKNKVGKWVEHKQSTKNVVIKKPMVDFLRNVSVVANDIMSDVVINERFCLNVHSFFMISCVDRLRCEACNVNLTLEQLDSHRNLPHHDQAMRETNVIISKDSEFLREVRPEEYHCGFCNLVFPCEDLQTHLASTNHREAKTSANWRLQQYLPEITHEERARQFGALMLMKMLSGESF